MLSISKKLLPNSSEYFSGHKNLTKGSSLNEHLIYRYYSVSGKYIFFLKSKTWFEKFYSSY